MEYLIIKKLKEEKILQKQLHIGILGFGTVGNGVLRILNEHTSKVNQMTGVELNVKSILVRDIHKKRENLSSTVHLTTNAADILNDPEIDIVVEVMGGIETAYTYIAQALSSGKHVVTANKDIIALHGTELVALAKENECDLLYEASVAGGIPILRTIVDSLAADRIQQIAGIVNGTTNFILTKMANDGKSYEDALADAQRLGFAESDPTSDVDGIDAARKMVILTRLAFGMNVELDQIETEGIRHLQKDDMETAKKLGYRIKLIGSAVKLGKSISLNVSPTLVPTDHPLAGVINENNAVLVKGAAVGETMFYGPGAGSLPTATSVVGDIITIAKNIQLKTTGKVFNAYQHRTRITADKDSFAKYYLTIEMQDKTGTFLGLANLFSDTAVGFDQIIQQPLSKHTAKVVVITHSINKEQQRTILKSINESKEMNVLGCYRVM